MKIIVKPEKINIISLNNYIKKGADAFLFAIKGLSLSNNQITLSNLIKLKKLLDKNIKIFCLIDKNIFNKDLKILEEALIKLEKMGIDGVLFYDLAILNIKNKLDLKLPVIWNQNYMVTNYETINYYYLKGVKTVLISSEVTMEDIMIIKEKTESEIMVNIFGYQMMSFSKRKLITNYFKYFNKNKTKNQYLITDGKTNNKYPILENKEGTIIFSNNVLNAIMEINNLKKANCEYVILNEQMVKHKDFLTVLSIYNSIIENDLDEAWSRSKNLEIKKIINNLDDGFFNKKTIFKVK